MSEPISRLTAALADRYRLERELGAGGMATVYLAEDLRHERRVALKVLKPELAAVVGGERFLAEIKTTAHLQHPNILPLFDSGEADGFLYYVMPYVEGETLRDRLDREGQLPVDDAVRIATAVAGALDYAHRHGVVHRDVKPGNILLQAGQPVVGDFGIALAVGAAGGARLTETGLSVGTPYYMSPEQATGEQRLGPSADIYSLGCVLHEMLAGEPPFAGITPQAVLAKIITESPAPVSKQRGSVPANVEAAIAKALERLPADRFTQASEFARALSDVGFRHGVPALAGARGGGRSAVLSSSIAVVMTCAFLWALFGRRPPEHHSEHFPSPFLAEEAPISVTPGSLALSDDGDRVVYIGPSAAVTSDLQLWERRWNEVHGRPIAGTAGVEFRGFDISATGEILFIRAGGVWLLDAQRSGVKSVGLGSWPHWGADGSIYFTTGQGTDRIPKSGGHPEPVTRLLDGDVAHVIQSVSEDGAVIYVAQRGSNELVVRAQRPGDSEPTLVTPVTSGFGAVLYLRPGYLVFAGPEGLTAATFDYETLELGRPETLIPSARPIDVSADGKLLYQISGGGSAASQWRFVWVSRTGELTTVDADDWFDHGGANSGWTLSPDGRHIAVRLRTTSGLDIWTKELPDGPRMRITSEPGEERKPWWSPDGSRILYLSDQNGDLDLWAKRSDGTGEAELLLDFTARIANAMLSPDGTWIVFRTAGATGASAGARDIYAIRPGVDPVPIPLIHDPAVAEFTPILSPDGRLLAYTSDETGNYDVFVRPFPDVDAKKTQISSGGGIRPVWSKTAAELFYLSEDGMTSVEYAADPDFRIVRKEVLFPIPERIYINPNTEFFDVSPVDSRFLMAQATPAQAAARGPSGAILMTGVLEEIRRLLSH